MPRIEGSQTPARVPARVEPPASQPAPTAAPAAAPASRARGFSPVSTFESGAARGGGTPKLSPNDLGVQAQDQGNTNACGTTSLANVMTHFGKPRTHEQIDQSVRAFDIFSAPDRLVDYARSNGMRADIKNDASLDDITRMVDQGAPPIVLMDPDATNNPNLHYITVTGYNRGANGQVSDVVLADSAGGRRYTMPAGEFQQRWGSLKLQDIPTGLNNVMITAVPNDGRRITGGDGATRNAGDIQLPKSDLWANVRSQAARQVASGLADKAKAAQTVINGAKNVWDSIFGK